MTADQLIDEARGYHETFDVARHTRKVCLQELRRAEKRFYDILSDNGSLAADRVFTTAEITAALDGAPLGEGESEEFTFSALLNALAYSDAGTHQVDLIEDELAGGTSRYRVRLFGEKLYIVVIEDVQAQLGPDALSRLRSDWEGIKALRVSYVPLPPSVTLLTDTVLTPEFGRPYLVGSLVKFMATRSTAIGPMGPQVAGVGAEMMQVCLDQAEEQQGRETPWYVRRSV